jgi:two-component system CheB/CheR fusion protein
MITVYDPNLQDFQLNREVERVLGWSTETARRVNLMEKCFPDPQYRQAASQYMRSPQPGWCDFQVTARDGSVVESSWSTVRLSDDTLIGIGIDMRERKQAEESLWRSEQLNLATLDALPAHIVVLDRLGTIVKVNAAWTTFARQNGDPESAKVSVGANYLDVCRQALAAPNPGVGEVLEGIEAVLNGRRLLFTMEYPCHSPDEQRWFLMNVVPLRDPIGGVVITHSNITERRRAEQALREAKEYAEHLLAVAAVIFVVLDERGRIQSLNRQGCEILECTEAEVIGRNWFETFIPARRRAELDSVFQQVLAADLTLAGYHENPVLTRSGEERLIAWHNTVLRDRDGKARGVLSSGEDITEARRSQTALAESEERFRVMADTVPGILFTTRADGWLDYVNPRFYDYTGLPPGEGEGWKWTRVLHPEDRERVAADWKQVLERGEPAVFRYRLRAADGSYRWFQIRVRPLRRSADRSLTWFGVSTDIDDLVHAEESLREADRRKNEFLAMLAHELRNPLAAIRNAVPVLDRLGQPKPKWQWAVAVIDRQVRHLARLVDDLLDVARIVGGKIALNKEPLALTAVVQQSLETARPLIEARRQQLIVKLPDEPVWLDGDPVRLTQVLVNLLDNAVKYTAEGGQIALSVERHDPQVVLRVHDTGMGMPAGLLSRVFDLFVQGERSLDRAAAGLGIGLTVVRQLVALHGGRVEARSAGPGQGAEFTVWLPVVTEPPAAGAAPPAAKPRAGLRVLVVEDDPDVADSLVVLLQLEDCAVRAAHTGHEALAAACTFQPQLVLLDIGLPGMDGYEVARRLRGQQPEGQRLLLVALSGYGDEASRARSQRAGFDRHLVKPVAPETLRALLAEGA